MTEISSRKQAQFEYWKLRRSGKTQSEIARIHDITRQAVNKSIKLAEREVLFRLLDSARMSGILVEWQDARTGSLIGITPQLGNLACLMIIDNENRIRIFYDQSNNKDKAESKRLMSLLQDILNEIFGLRIKPKDDFKNILKKIVNL